MYESTEEGLEVQSSTREAPPAPRPDHESIIARVRNHARGLDGKIEALNRRLGELSFEVNDAEDANDEKEVRRLEREVSDIEDEREELEDTRQEIYRLLDDHHTLSVIDRWEEVRSTITASGS